MTGLRRDGHASDLGIEWLANGEAPAELHEHCASCALCSARLAEVQRQDQPTRPHAAWLMLVALAAMLLAAVIANPTQDIETSSDVFRPKGAAIELQLWRDASPSSQRVVDGDEVWVADHIGFRLDVDTPGFLMVVGRDQRGAAWQYVPASGDAVPMAATEGFEDIEHAVELDEVLGMERFVAVLCDHPFALSDVADVLTDDIEPTDWLAPLSPDCAQSEVRVLKVQP